MSHKKEIYTAVFKILPYSGLFLEKGTKLEDFNALCAAFYYLFNSAILTKKDYIHITDVLCEKFPIYELGGDIDAYKHAAVTYATFGYPPCDDLARVIGDFIDHVPAVPTFMLGNALRTMRLKLADASEFVGVEMHGKGFTLTPLTAEELASIKKITLV
ncbi:MAG: hypothetical protein IJV96_06125 [Clostridia bacterium]|nr:hypothetical protein [Clostridia bacterium]